MAHQQRPHVHGVATLQITQDKDIVSIDLQSPLANLLGFEHAPHTAEQKQAVQMMIKQVSHPENLFVLTPAAQCMSAPVTIKAPALNLDTSLKNEPGEDYHHSEIEVSVTFHCQNPEALATMETKFFTVFPNTHRLEAQMVGLHGQSAATLTAQRSTLFW